MEKLFKLKQHGTNVKTEIIAGITTFLAMSYILAVNPGMLGIIPDGPGPAAERRLCRCGSAAKGGGAVRLPVDQLRRNRQRAAGKAGSKRRPVPVRQLRNNPGTPGALYTHADRRNRNPDHGARHDRGNGCLRSGNEGIADHVPAGFG